MHIVEAVIEIFIFAYLFMGVIENMLSESNATVHGGWQMVYEFLKPISLLPLYPFAYGEHAVKGIWALCRARIEALPQPWDAVAAIFVLCCVIFSVTSISASLSRATAHASSIVNSCLPFVYSVWAGVTVFVGLGIFFQWTNTLIFVSLVASAVFRMMFPWLKRAADDLNAWFIAKTKIQ